MRSTNATISRTELSWCPDDSSSCYSAAHASTCDVHHLQRVSSQPCFGVFVCVPVSCPVGPEQWSPKFSIWQKRLGTTTRTLSQVTLYYTSGALKHCVHWPFINLHAVITCGLLSQRYVLVMWPVSTETAECRALYLEDYSCLIKLIVRYY